MISACNSRYWTSGESNNTDTTILSSWNWNLTDSPTPFTYTNWRPREPNNWGSSSEKYLIINNFGWCDVKTNYNNACPVCESNLRH